MAPAPPPLLEHIDADTLRVFCPAKVNLALSVGPPQDDGLHPIASWMVPIGFGDTLTLRRSEGFNQFAVNFAEDAPLREAMDWPLSSDLSYRAWQAVKEYTGRPLPMTARLEKRIPAGAGLGGGSADAAGMLDGLNEFFGLGISEDALLSIAGGLGSDVVFQLAARWRPGGALVSGTGGRITPLPKRDPVPLLLVLPGVHCATAEVYAAFDASASHEPRGADRAGIEALAAQSIGPGTELFNDLAPAACAVQPRVGAVMQALTTAGHTPHVTGSGSTVFAVLDNADTDTLEAARHTAQEATGCVTVLTRTAG